MAVYEFATQGVRGETIIGTAFFPQISPLLTKERLIWQLDGAVAHRFTK